MHDLYIAKIYRPGRDYLSAADGGVGLSSFTSHSELRIKIYSFSRMLRYGRSRSLNVVEIGTKSKARTRLPISLPL